MKLKILSKFKISKKYWEIVFWKMWIFVFTFFTLRDICSFRSVRISLVLPTICIQAEALSKSEICNKNVISLLFCLERGLKGTVIALAGAYFSYNYFSNSPITDPEPGMIKEKWKTKSILQMLAPLQISYKSHQTARNNFWNWKNLKFVKTQKRSKLKNFTSLDQKFVHPPPFWEGKTRATRGYGRRLGLPLSYSWTQ